MIYFVILFCAALFLFSSMLSLYHIICSIKWSKYEKIKCCDEDPFIFTLIPALREQKVILETIQHFRKINYPSKHHKIVIITTQKERKIKGGNTTRELVRDYISKTKDQNIILIHCPHKTGGKATQLNYAIKKLKHEIKDFHKTYFSIYDADSRPDKNTFLEVASLVSREKYPLVLQQFSTYFKNFSSQSDFLKTSAIFQTWWTYRHELPVARQQYELIRLKKINSLLRRLTYTIGHGLFVRTDVFNKVILFPEDTPIEDIPFGYILSFNNIPITPLKSFDHCEVPNRISALCRQASVWYAGETSLSFKMHGKVNKFTKTFMILKRNYMNTKWALGSVFFIVLSTISILKGYYYPLLIIFIATLMAYIIPFIIIKLKHNLSISWSSLLLCGYLRISTNFLGPTIYYFNVIKSKVFNIPLTFPKTER